MPRVEKFGFMVEDCVLCFVFRAEIFLRQVEHVCCVLCVRLRTSVMFLVFRVEESDSRLRSVSVWDSRCALHRTALSFGC